MDIKRGDVYWWHCPEHNRPHLLNKVRPVVVISNDQCNSVSKVVTVAPMTTKVHRAFPTQVPVVFNDGISIVLLDKMTSIPVEELGYRIEPLKDFQMEQVDKAILVQLGLMPKEGLSAETEEDEPIDIPRSRNTWNAKEMSDYCSSYENIGPEGIARAYGITQSTVKAYYKRFQKKIRG